MSRLAFFLFFVSLLVLGSASPEEEPLPRRLVLALHNTPGCENPSLNGAWKITDILGLCGNKFCSLPMQFCSAVVREGRKVSLECASLSDTCQAVITKELSGRGTQAFGNEKRESLGSLPSLEKPCMDSNQFCCFWAFFGECEKNSAFMKTRCQKSCGTCSCKESDKSLCEANVNVEGCKWIPKRGRQSDSPLGKSGYGEPAPPPQPSPYGGQGGSSCGTTSTGSCGYWPIAEKPTFQAAVASPYGSVPSQPVPAPQPVQSYGSLPSPPVPQVMPAPQPVSSYGSVPSPAVQPAPQPISSYDGSEVVQLLITPGPPAHLVSIKQQAVAPEQTPEFNYVSQLEPNYETQLVKPAPVPQGPYGGGEQPVINIPAPPTYDITNRCGPSAPCGPVEPAKPPVVTRRPPPPPPPPRPRPIIHDFCSGGGATQAPSQGTSGDTCQPAVLKPRPPPRPTSKPPPRPSPRPQPSPPPSNLINCAPGGGGPCGVGQPAVFPYPQPMPQPAPGGTVNCAPGAPVCGTDSYQQVVQPQPQPQPMPASPYGLRKQAMKLTFYRGRLMYQKQ